MARSPVRILLVLAMIAVLGLTLVALGVVGVGSAQAERSGAPLPGARWKVAKISGTEVSTGQSEPWQFREFVWRTGFAAPRGRERVAPSAFCVFVGVEGPFVRTPGGGGGGAPDNVKSECGPIRPGAGLVKTVPTQEGSLKQPYLGNVTYTWPSFDVGVVAYPMSVDKVRLRFAGGGSIILPLKGMPASVRPSKWEPFKYASFGVYGCVEEVEGLSAQRVVARAPQSECDG